jgi:hypothetical protein
MTQTSIEWLVEQFKDYDCTPVSNNDEYVIVMPQWIFNAKRDEALEMHKQEILNAFSEGASDGFNGKFDCYYFNSPLVSNREKYYQETFKKD